MLKINQKYIQQKITLNKLVIIYEKKKNFTNYKWGIKETCEWYIKNYKIF